METRAGRFILVLAALSLLTSLHYGEPYVPPEPVPLLEQPTLPETCRPYYRDGTDRWIECMGVGRK